MSRGFGDYLDDQWDRFDWTGWFLEDRAVDQVADTDVDRYAVVRVADEMVVDLMARACGIEYADRFAMSNDRRSVVSTFPSQAPSPSFV